MNAVEQLAFPNTRALTDAVARRWLAEVTAGATHGKGFSVALSGGRIARPLYETVVATTGTRLEPWREVEFFFADERWVPLDDPASNYRLARQYLFDPLRIANHRVHPLQVSGELEFAVTQAQAEVLRATTLNVQGDPVLDLVILGMGEDGHVASLFPDAPPAVFESRAVYLAVRGPKPPPQRVTLSYAVLAAARRVWVLVSGAGKGSVLKASLAAAATTPLAHVLRSRRHTVLFTDSP
jgi:6-phosphogluconolactonase